MGNLGPIQIISIFGLIFSAIAQVVLFLVDKQVDNYWMLYPTWIGIFIFGWILKRTGKGHDHHH